MNKTEIMNTYAIEQGYVSWEKLMKNNFKYEIQIHINNVTDLIQEELKKKIAENKHPFTQEILNTEIL